MHILIIRGNIETPKSYPYWEELLVLLKDHKIKEVKGMLQEKYIIELINWCDVWISIDSFIQHLVKYHKLKKGIVLWGKSNPEIFGYGDNINLLKGPVNFRTDQFGKWSEVKHREEDFVLPEVILKEITNML